MIPAIAVGVALLVILVLVGVTTSPKFNTETPQPQQPCRPHPGRTTELTADERATWEQIVASLKAADHG